jgi:hypothetical protein
MHCISGSVFHIKLFDESTLFKYVFEFRLIDKQKKIDIYIYISEWDFIKTVLVRKDHLPIPTVNQQEHY